MQKILRFAAFSAGAVLAGAGVASAQEAPPPANQPPAHPPHTVAAGESLSKISQAELGTSDRWVEIFAVNRDAIADPDVIDVGQVLNIPSGPVAVPADLLASVAPLAAPASSSSRQSATTSGQRATSSQAGSSGGGAAGGNLAAIRACESGGDYGSTDGQYRGAYQFDSETWASVGGTGDPAAASPAEQDSRALQLQAQRGSNPWPNCG